MKTRFLLILLVVGMSSALSASPLLEGFWNNYEHNITLEIRVTPDGFKAKRTDSRDWYYYKQQSSRRFTDRDGNSYLIDDENTLIWRDYYSNKNLRFFRRDIERVPELDRSRRPYDHRAMIRAMEGRWYHPMTNESVYVYSRNVNLRIRTRRGTSTYHSTAPGIFEDSRGNKIRLLQSGRLEHFYRGNIIILERERGRNIWD